MPAALTKAKTMTDQSRPRALLIQREFPTWAAARAWTYSAGHAIEEGLTTNGVECVTIPAIVGTPSSSPESWLFHAKQWLQ